MHTQFIPNIAVVGISAQFLHLGNIPEVGSVTQKKKRGGGR